MSIHPIPKSLPENSKNVELNENNVPPQIIEKADTAAKDHFFQDGLSEVISEDTKKWVIEKMTPAIIEVSKLRSEISTDQMDAFLKKVSEKINPMINKILRINFSRGYELDKRTYPTLEEFKDIASWLKSIQKTYSLFKKQENFALEFKAIFYPFLDTLLMTIREQALASRNLQYTKILENPGAEDFEEKEAATRLHIKALKEKKQQPLHELRDVLNLSQFDWLERKPSTAEQKAFIFLSDIYDS
jgi:hypothetical protein